MAEWARLLSECWVKPVAGSNPAFPATGKRVPQWARFFVSFHGSPQGDDMQNRTVNFLHCTQALTSHAPEKTISPSNPPSVFQ